MAAGIDDISVYIPRLYVDASDFAEARGLDPQKLVRGLGISKMAIVDANQDPACLAANACLKIMQKNKNYDDDLKLGKFSYHMVSAHVYERDFEYVNNWS